VPDPRRLVFVGEVVIDVTTWVPTLPGAGGDVLATAASLTPGGGFNVMAAAARQGVPVVFAGRHGTGIAGATVRAALAAEGVEVAGAADPGADTGFVVTMVQPDGERTFVTSPAALSGLDAAGLAAVPAGSGDLVYVSGYGLLSEHGAALAGWVSDLDAAISVVVDPGSLAGLLPRPALDVLLARADWWSCNRLEAEQITGMANPAGAGAVLARRRDGGGVVVRDGAAGCLLVVRGPAPERGRWIKSPAVDVVDTTGAGDAHVGVFVAGLAHGLDPFEAAQRATFAAALSVTRRGPATAPGRDELDRWIGAGI
jgi:sugar/nucleoside kinase (ribokinase family)